VGEGIKKGTQRGKHGYHTARGVGRGKGDRQKKGVGENRKCRKPYGGDTDGG